MKDNLDYEPFGAGVQRELQAWQERLWCGKAGITVAETAVPYQVHEGMMFHNHIELFFQRHGENRFTLPGSAFTLREGTMAVVPPGVPHGENARDGRHPFDMLVVMAGPDWLTFIRAGRGEDGTPTVRDLISTPSPEYAKFEQAMRCGRSYLAEAQSRITGSRLMAALIGECIRALDLPVAAPDETGSLVSRCQALMRTYFSSQDCNVEHLAGELGYSPNYLSTRYRKETGERLSAVLTRMRLERAATLLSESGSRVNDIALASGFTDASYFIACFRKAYGETPLAYRRRRT